MYSTKKKEEKEKKKKSDRSSKAHKVQVDIAVIDVMEPNKGEPILMQIP